MTQAVGYLDHPHTVSYDDSCMICWQHVKHNIAPHAYGEPCPICEGTPEEAA